MSTATKPQTNLLAEGIWPCTVTSAAWGANDKNSTSVQVNVRIDDGPSKGRTCTYEDEVTNKSSLYISRSCKAIGWAGESLRTLAADVTAWIAKSGGKTTVEIKHIEIKNGKRAGQIWDKPNSIGRGPKVLKEAGGDALADADLFMKNAALADGGTPANDETAGPADPDDLPFARAHGNEPSAIARVLRGAL